MAEEYFDIVDEDNNLTGEQRSRKEVHEKGLWHRTVHIYYINKENNNYYFLVHLRSRFKDLDPNKWDTRFGGHLKAGQTIEEALVEELKEEIGITAEVKDFIKGPVKKSNNEFNYIFYYFGKRYLSDLNFQDKEVQKVKWMSGEEIIKELKNNSNNWTTSLDSFQYIYDFLTELYPLTD